MLGAGSSSPPAFVPGVVATLALVAVLASSRFDAAVVGRWLLPVVGIAGAMAVGSILARRHPAETWLASFLVGGVVFKLFASLVRYRVFVDSYSGVGDATNYHLDGSRFALAWLGRSSLPAPELDHLRKTNFVKWFTGAVYYLFGVDILVGYFAFGLLAVIGSYLWYRATVDAVPFADKRLYMLLVMFAPSIAFWPASIGKEALMQLGIGSASLGVSNLLRGRLVRAAIAGFGGCWLLWVVRPHVLALVTLATALAFIVGRNPRTRSGPVGGSLRRTLGAVGLALLVVFAVSEGLDKLGVEEFSLSAIEDELDETSRRTAQGGSEFGSGEASLSPLHLPEGMATVLLRPFPWEVDSAFQILASLESVALVAFIVHRRKSVGASLRHARSTPFLFYAWTFVAIYAATFSAFSNFGLLVRQRSLVLPALFVLLSVDAAHARADQRRSEPYVSPLRPPSPHDAGG
jgi:hypothetical protein